MRKHRLVIAGVTLLAAHARPVGLRHPSQASPGRLAAPARPPRSASSPRCPATSPPSAWASRTPSTWPSSRPTTTRRSPAGRSRSTPRTTRPRPTSARTPPPSCAGDDQVVGVVGTLNSSVAPAASSRSSPRRNITQVSPANTNPTLTQGADCATAPKRAVPDLLPHLHHGRVQGPFAAQYLLDTGHQEGRHDPRQEDLRPGPGRSLHRGVQERRRQGRRAETINPDERLLGA